MQTGLIVRAFLASPGDVQSERGKALKVIDDWNAANSVNREAIIEIVRAEKHARLAQGDHPQEIINRQLLERCDFLIAVFGAKLGTPTNHERSGTIHEIKEFIELKGPENVLLFFSQKLLAASVDTARLDELRAFQKDMASKGLYSTYKSVADFGHGLGHQLNLVMNHLLASDKASGPADAQGLSSFHIQVCAGDVTAPGRPNDMNMPASFYRFHGELTGSPGKTIDDLRLTLRSNFHIHNAGGLRDFEVDHCPDKATFRSTRPIHPGDPSGQLTWIIAAPPDLGSAQVTGQARAISFEIALSARDCDPRSFKVDFDKSEIEKRAHKMARLTPTPRLTP